MWVKIFEDSLGEIAVPKIDISWLAISIIFTFSFTVMLSGCVHSLEINNHQTYVNAYKNMLVKYEGYSKGSPVGDSFILIPPKPGTERERKRMALNNVIREMDIEDEVKKATAEIRAKYDR